MMTVKLISYTTPTEELVAQDIDSILDLIAFCARVSNPKNQYNTETYEKLVKYLITHKHWSPLELVNATLSIETTRDISRQILRHRSFSFNEYSQRYADPTSDLEFVTREARLQDIKNRQSSIKVDNSSQLHEMWELKQQEVVALTKDVYKWAIDYGIAKEQARVVLPEGLIKSRIYMNGTLRSWVHYIEIRSAEGTQKEHREIAIGCAREIAKVFPMIRDFVHEV